MRKKRIKEKPEHEGNKEKWVKFSGGLHEEKKRQKQKRQITNRSG